MLTIHFAYERLFDFCYVCGCRDHTMWACSKSTTREGEPLFGPWLRAKTPGKAPPVADKNHHHRQKPSKVVPLTVDLELAMPRPPNHATPIFSSMEPPITDTSKNGKGKMPIRQPLGDVTNRRSATTPSSLPTAGTPTHATVLRDSSPSLMLIPKEIGPGPTLAAPLPTDLLSPQSTNSPPLWTFPLPLKAHSKTQTDEPIWHNTPTLQLSTPNLSPKHDQLMNHNTMLAKCKSVGSPIRANKISAVLEDDVSDSFAKLGVAKRKKVLTLPAPELSEFIMEERVDVQYRRFIHVKKMARTGGNLSSVHDLQNNYQMTYSSTTESKLAQEAGLPMPPTGP